MEIEEIMEATHRVEGGYFNYKDTWHWVTKINGHEICGNPMYTKRQIAEGIQRDMEEED